MEYFYPVCVALSPGQEEQVNALLEALGQKVDVRRSARYHLILDQRLSGRDCRFLARMLDGIAEVRCQLVGCAVRRIPQAIGTREKLQEALQCLWAFCLTAGIFLGFTVWGWCLHVSNSWREFWELPIVGRRAWVVVGVAIAIFTFLMVLALSSSAPVYPP
jgi:hypothetical protein